MSKPSEAAMNAARLIFTPCDPDDDISFIAETIDSEFAPGIAEHHRLNNALLQENGEQEVAIKNLEYDKWKLRAALEDARKSLSRSIDKFWKEDCGAGAFMLDAEIAASYRKIQKALKDTEEE